jgi:hypothetical protein
MQESELSVEVKLVTTVYDGEGNEFIRIDEVIDPVGQYPPADSNPATLHRDSLSLPM